MKNQEMNMDLALAEADLRFAKRAASADNSRANRKAVHVAQAALRETIKEQINAELDEKFSGAVVESRRRRMTLHKGNTINVGKSKAKARKAKHAPPTAQNISTENISLADAPERYARSIEWANKKEQDKAPKVAPVVEKAKDVKSDAERLVRANETKEIVKAPVDLRIEKIFKLDKSITDISDLIDEIEVAIVKADIRVNAEFAKADAMVAENLAIAEGLKGRKGDLAQQAYIKSVYLAKADKAKAVQVFAHFKARAEEEIDELKNKLLKLVEKKEKLLTKEAEHLKKVAEAKAEADAKAARKAEQEEIEYLFRFGEVWAEPMKAAEAAVREALEGYADVDYRYERMVARYDGWTKKFEELKPVQKTLKAKRTRLQRKYKEASPEEQAKLYEEIRKLNAEANAAIKNKAEAAEQLAKAEDDLVTYILAMPELKAEADKKLAKACEHKQEILALIKHETRYNKLQDALEETFEQRYERADYVPEKEDAQRYKVYNIPVMKLYAHQALLLKQMQELVAKPEEEREPGWLQKGKELFKQFRQTFKDIKEFKVDAKDCVVNNVTGSAMSDIMGINYGSKEACKEMVLVNYDTNALKVYWKFVSDDYKEANDRLHNMRVYVVERLLNKGVDMKIGDEEVHYDLLASSPSQQKKGQAYMGEKETMERTSELREFGLTLKEAIVSRTDNAVEWLKRNATLTTPSKIYRNQKGKTIPLRKVLMMKDVDIEREFDNVVTIDGKSKKTPSKKKLSLTMYDGQGLALKKGIPSSQMRGPAMKFMLCALPDYKLPEYATDILGRRVRVADYDILLTKSCWKAAKMGMNWEQFVQMAEKLAERCEGYDLLRSVRYSDREIGDEENPRNLARQATQQWVDMPDEDIEGLTRKTRRWLKAHKQYRTILKELCELDRPEEERSPLAKLFAAFPQLVMHPYIQQWLETSWTAKRNKACSGRIRTKGQYPYIVQDPIAMIQILLEGKDPMSEGLGVVPAGMVNLPKVRSGRKVYAVRYPANYMVGMVLEQINVPAFNNLGNVAVLSYYGDTIVRADGDFDGDEMLFIFDKIVIETMQRIIDKYRPSLIDFPHGKIPCDTPFGTRDVFVSNVADALVRAQEYNQVGLYSNLAVICLQQASIAYAKGDFLMCGKWLNAAKIAHVGAIICLDLVKGAKVPKELLAALETLNESVRKAYKMPWNQQFSHPEAEHEKRSVSTQDKIAGLIFDDAGEFKIEFEKSETPVKWLDSLVLDMMPNESVKTTNVRSWVVPETDVARLRGCRFEDEFDQKSWDKLDNGQKIGFADWMKLGWHNSSSIVWKMSGADMAEKRQELDYYIRQVAMDNVRLNEWVRTEDGYVFTMAEKYSTLVKFAIRMALGKGVKDGIVEDVGNGIDESRKGSFAMFVLRIFATDILAMIENGGVISDELAAELVMPRPVEEFTAPACFDESDEDLAAIMDDGSFWLGGNDCDEYAA